MRGEYEELEFRIQGDAPLLHHNGQLADPLNPYARALAEVSGKRSKVEEDHREMGRREFVGALYGDETGPVLPADMVEAVLVEGAKLEKKGPAAKAGIVVEQHASLEYDGPRDAEGLWKDQRFRMRAGVRVQGSRVFRTRPIFNDWAATVRVSYLPSLLDEESVRRFLDRAGAQKGLGDWRPRYGRFSVVEMPAAKRARKR